MAEKHKTTSGYTDEIIGWSHEARYQADGIAVSAHVMPVSFETGLGRQLPPDTVVDYDSTVVHEAAIAAGVPMDRWRDVSIVIAQPQDSAHLAPGLHGYTTPLQDGAAIAVRYDPAPKKMTEVVGHELYHAGKRLAGAPSPLDSPYYNLGTHAMQWAQRHRWPIVAGAAGTMVAQEMAVGVEQAVPLETVATLGSYGVMLAGGGILLAAAGNACNGEERQARRAGRCFGRKQGEVAPAVWSERKHHTCEDID
jgi:hypothetical protein